MARLLKIAKYVAATVGLLLGCFVVLLFVDHRRAQQKWDRRLDLEADEAIRLWKASGGWTIDCKQIDTKDFDTFLKFSRKDVAPFDPDAYLKQLSDEKLLRLSSGKEPSENDWKNAAPILRGGPPPEFDEAREFVKEHHSDLASFIRDRPTDVRVLGVQQAMRDQCVVPPLTCEQKKAIGYSKFKLFESGCEN